MKTMLRRPVVGLSVASAGLAAVAGILFVALAGGPAAHPSALAQTGGSPAREDRAIRVKIVRPTREHLKRSTSQPAHVEPYEKADLFAKVSGYLKAVHVDIGDRVKADQVLAEIRVPELEQEQKQKEALVERAQADVEQAEASQKAAQAMVEAARKRVEQAQADIARSDAEVAFRKVEHERYQRLVAERSIQKDLADEKLNQFRAAEAAATASKAAVGTAQANVRVEDAKLVKAGADVASAQARVKVARANFQQTIVQLDYAVLKAPFDGVITRRLVDSGAFIQSATTGKSEPLFTLARVDRMRIVIDVPESECALVKIGQTAVLQVGAARGQQFAGKVARFADALDTRTRTMRAEVELDASTTALRPGMFGSVTVSLANLPNSLMLPANVLLNANGKTFVIIVEGDKARRRDIELGYNDGIRVQVLRGLTGDEAVITDGKNALQEGQAVEVVP